MCSHYGAANVKMSRRLRRGCIHHDLTRLLLMLQSCLVILDATGICLERDTAAVDFQQAVQQQLVTPAFEL